MLLRATALRRGLRLPQDIAWSKNRFSKRMSNMQEEDRIKFYNWNLFCVLLTAVPASWLYSKNWDTSEETEKIYRTLDPMRMAECRYNSGFYG